MHPYRYSLSLRFRHPSIPPDDIESILSMTAEVKQRRGEPKTTPKGRLISNRPYTSNYCCIHLSKGTDRGLPRAMAAARKRLGRFHEYLQKYRRTGGKIEFFLGLFLDGNSGFVLSSEEMASLSKSRN